MKKHITIILSAIIALTFVSFMANDSILLRFKPKVGKAMTCNVKTSQVMNMNVQGQNVTNSQSIESKVQMTATKITSDSIFCDTQLKSMKMTQSAMGMTMTFDTEHPENTSPMLKAAMNSIQESIGKNVTVVFDQLGNALKMPSDNLPSFSAIYPEEAISAGSKWTSTNSQNMAGADVDVTTTYTVVKITKKETTIDIESVIKADAASGTSTGSMVIDNATGLTKSSTIKSDMSITISEQGLSIPTKITGNTTVTFE